MVEQDILEAMAYLWEILVSKRRDDTTECYTDDAGEFRWRVLAANGETIADSAEGYTDRAHCVKMAKRVTGRVPVEETA